MAESSGAAYHMIDDGVDAFGKLFRERVSLWLSRCGLRVQPRTSFKG